MLPRFLASIDASATTARLDAEEARHLSQVLRLGTGDEVAVFDGKGREFSGRVASVTRRGAVVQLLAEVEPAAEPAVRLTLAQAGLKGEKMEDVIRDATMMGAAAIVPVITDRTVARLSPGSSPERWYRIAVSSAKQCRRAVVPTVAPAVPLSGWLADDPSALKILLTEPSAGAAEKWDLSPFSGKRGQVPFPGQPEKRGQVPFSATLLVGPEGGWTPAEIAAAVAAGYEPVTLGRRTLRADAVPIVAIAVMQYLWGDL